MAKIPSIATIPSGYKAGKVYSVLPVDGGGDFTFDRGASTTQTRVNKDGLIENVDQDVPRLDYLDGGCPSLLLEPATTNLLTYSEDFTDPSWVKSNGGTGSVPIVTSNQGIAPDGALTADRIVFDLNGGTTSSDISTLSSSATLTGTNVNNRSIYLKSNTGLSYDIIFGTNDADNTNAIVTITVTNEWQRFDITQINPLDTTTNIYFGLRYVGGVVSLSDTADILIWGAQLEQQSYATSYIPTSGSTATRAAETCNGSGTADDINSVEGVLYAEIRALANDGTIRRIALSDTTTNNVVRLEYSSTDNRLFGVLYNGSNQGTIFVDNFTATDYIKVAYKYSVNDFSLYLNGLLVKNVTSGTTFSANTLSELSFDNGGGGNPFYGRVKRLSVYDSALNDLELARLTGFTSFASMANYLNYTIE